MKCDPKEDGRSNQNRSMVSKVDRTQEPPTERNYWPPKACSASFPAHNPKNTPALDTMSTALPTIVAFSETGDDNPPELPLEMGLTIAAIWGDDIAVNDVLGFAGRDRLGLRGGTRNVGGEGVWVVPTG